MLLIARTLHASGNLSNCTPYYKLSKTRRLVLDICRPYSTHQIPMLSAISHNYWLRLRSTVAPILCRICHLKLDTAVVFGTVSNTNDFEFKRSISVGTDTLQGHRVNISKFGNSCHLANKNNNDDYLLERLHTNTHTHTHTHTPF